MCGVGTPARETGGNCEGNKCRGPPFANIGLTKRMVRPHAASGRRKHLTGASPVNEVQYNRTFLIHDYCHKYARCLDPAKAELRLWRARENGLRRSLTYARHRLQMSGKARQLVTRHFSAPADHPAVRKDFWEFLISRHPIEEDYARSTMNAYQWRSIPKLRLVIVQFVSKHGVGVFVRDERSANPDEVEHRLRPYAVRLEKALGVDEFFLAREFQFIEAQ